MPAGSGHFKIPAMTRQPSQGHAHAKERSAGRNLRRKRVRLFILVEFICIHWSASIRRAGLLDEIETLTVTVKNWEDNDILRFWKGVETRSFEITVRCERYSCTLNVILSLIPRNETNSLCLRRRSITNQNCHF
jgi:hypothetical protein